MIHLYNVTKVYQNGVRALADINLRVKKGEFVFLVGPSGAGKSSLLKLLYREELPSQGQVMFSGKNVQRMHRGEVPYLRRKIGMVFQDFRLLPQKTVVENISFALEVTGASRGHIRKAVPNILQKVGMLEKASCYPAQLSGGEQQRVGIARAIVNNPLLILADEPTGNLDPETSQEIVNLFKSINCNGTTIIMSTHDQNIVDDMKRRVVAMAEGKIVRDEEKGVYSCES